MNRQQMSAAVPYRTKHQN